MSIGESIINYLRSGRDDSNRDGVNLRDLCTAIMFAESSGESILQVRRRENIPYVRRAVFQLLGQPSFETSYNELRYNDGGFTIRIVYWPDDPSYDHRLRGYHWDRLFFIDVNGEWEGGDPNSVWTKVQE